MRLGVDISTYLDELEANAKYFCDSKEVNPLGLFRANGVDLIRLRVWNNPYSEEGLPYLAGTNGIENTLKIINLTKGFGYSYIIDFHYSDFWADPSKQMLPKSWKNLSFAEILNELYTFTKENLIKIKALNVSIPYIQIGNEITNGMVWPYGKLECKEGEAKRSNYENLVLLLNAGIKAAREVIPEAKIIIHLERSNDYKVYEEFFDELQSASVDYDIIGMSYYPYWHGTMKELFFNINNCKKRYGKNVMIAELGFGFTLEDYLLTNNGTSQLKINKENLEASLEYEVSIKGQEKFIEDFIARSKKENLEGVIYWEPLWIPGEGICWASKEGQKYINEEGKSTRNEWANQCLFDYSGEMLPGFNKFKL